jgi:hypothetical protein
MAKRKISAPAGNRTPFIQTVTTVTILTELLRAQDITNTKNAEAATI